MQELGLIKSSPEKIYLKACSASFSQSTECLIPDLHPEPLPGGAEGQELQRWWLNTSRSRRQASIHSWQSLTEEHICATVSESLEKYSRCGKVILGWESHPIFTGVPTVLPYWGNQRMEGPHRRVPAEHRLAPSVPFSFQQQWKQQRAFMGIRHLSSRGHYKEQEEKKTWDYDHHHLGSGMLWLQADMTYWLGLPYLISPGEKECISVRVQVHESENILATFNTKIFNIRQKTT